MSDDRPTPPTGDPRPGGPGASSAAGSGGDADGAGPPWLPPSAGRARARRWPWLLLVLVLLLPLLWAAVLAAVGLAATERVDVAGLGDAPGVTNVLVVGSDTRAGLSAAEQRELTTGGGTGPERTDTILLVQTRGSDVALLSFPRDLWVERCDGSVQRINTAVQVGGPTCLVETVRRLSGIEVEHVVRVGFGGFVEVVDAVGGVEVCLPRAIADRDAGIDLPAGCQVLDGVDSLGYVRVRKIDDDLQRVRRQQEFLGALAERLARPATVLVPTTALSTARALGGAVTLDTGTSTLDLLRLAPAARGLAGGGAARQVVPTTPDVVDGAQVLRTAPEAEALFASFRDGSVLDTVDDVAGRAGPRDETRVVVLNGARVGGLAGTTAEQLRVAGYLVDGVGNADPVTRTTVQHPEGLAAEAERLADDLAPLLGSRPEVVRTGPGSALTLVLGTDLRDG